MWCVQKTMLARTNEAFLRLNRSETQTMMMIFGVNFLKLFANLITSNARVGIGNKRWNFTVNFKYDVVFFFFYEYVYNYIH